MYNLLERLKNWFIDLFKSRAFVLGVLFTLMFSGLVGRVFYLQIVKGQEYLDNYKLQIQKTREVQGTRGKILDRNGVVLADNKLAFSVTIEDNGDYDTTEEKNEIINGTISTIIDIVESNGDEIINDFKIVLGDSGKYEYSVDSETQRNRFLADVFGFATIEQLQKDKNNYDSYSAKELIDHLCSENKYGIDQEAYSKADVLKMVNIRYAISLNRFKKYVPTTIATDVSEETTAAIMENLDTLQGVNIVEDSLRVYPDSKYFASLLGYTGQISQSEYDAMDKKTQEKYSLTDIVGKTGLEQVLDETLKGEKGEIKLYVNSVGKVIETVHSKESKAGDNVYLSIDAKLQKAAYDLLEEKLAGIVLSRMRNVMNYDRELMAETGEVIIPADDVYNAFFANEIIDIGHLEEKDAKSTEKLVYKNFIDKKERVLKQLDSNMQDASASSYKDSKKETQAYLSYIVNDLLTTNAQVLVKDRIDTEDETYLAWREGETININEYLQYALAKNWIDTSKLTEYMESEGNYTDMSETYQALIRFVEAELATDAQFDKLIYKYMIKNGDITGRHICLILFEQDVLEYDESDYNQVNTGAISAYSFIRNKIKSLEITPGQLGLEPCTGSVVMTDTKTGQVLACVSYPGYDNNRLANNMDASYYSKLIHDQSSPLYNNATQEKTAPGSTYKPLVAIAALNEGTISTDTVIKCDGVFDKIQPETKCAVYPSYHGSLNVITGIQNSCNDFFCDVGYRLGLTGNRLEDGSLEYKSDQGLATLRKYAIEFGFDQTSGIEISESEPEISDEDSTRSAIGQGTNNYTTAQIARYITAVANKGSVYDLTLLKHSESVDGKDKKEYETEVIKEIDDVSDYVWSTVHTGMRAMVKNSNTFKSLDSVALAGKTGTAQQSKTHANHALFVGFAPYEDPEIAFAIRIANGYTSTYTAEVGRDLMKYYYGEAKLNELVTGEAAEVAVPDSSID